MNIKKNSTIEILIYGLKHGFISALIFLIPLLIIKLLLC